MSVSQRIKELIDEKYTGKVLRFAKTIGQERADNTYNVIKGRNQPGLDYLEAILDNHPDISAEWLLRGEGSMLKEDRVYPNDYEEIKEENRKLLQVYKYVTGELWKGKIPDGKKIAELL